MTTLWATLGGKLVESRLAVVFTPAFFFWIAGGAIVIDAEWGWDRARRTLDSWPDFDKTVAVLAALLLVSLSAVVVSSLALPVVRALEGYWPPWLTWARRRLEARVQLDIEKSEKRFEELATKQERTDAENEEFLHLEERLLWIPARREDLMPTRLGNVLRTAETRPRIKHGLDSVLCWPRLWLVLPDQARADVDSARSSLDGGAALFLWGLLFCVWGAFNLLAVVAGLATALYSYRSMLGAAKVYGELLDSAYDLYRVKLYIALGWPLPKNPHDDREQGKRLSQYLLRGSDEPVPVFGWNSGDEHQSDQV